jgi:hypothetical protein
MTPLVGRFLAGREGAGHLRLPALPSKRKVDMTRFTILIAVTAAVFVGVTASFATAHSKGKHSEHLSYGNVNSVVLDNTQGHVHITATRGTSHVTVERTTQTLFTKATSTASMQSGVLHLASRCHGTVCQVDYRISTPAGIRLKITDRNATVSIDGTPGNLVITNTGEGDVTLNLDRAPRQIRTSTYNGVIGITVPHGAYAVLARTSNGNKTITGITVDSHAHHTLRATADSGNITINGR